MTELERRYLRLLWAYPAEYRRARGAEIVGTYLDLADPGRRRPSLADAADLVRGGLRERLRAAGVTDLLPGVRLAAALAFLAATALAGFWAVPELHPPASEFGLQPVGPFASLGMAAWAAWLLAAVGYALTPPRWARPLLWLAVAVTALILPVSAATGLSRPPLFVLAPQLALGVVALGLPPRAPAPARLIPLATAVGAVAFAALPVPYVLLVGYRDVWTFDIPVAVGVVLLLVATAVAIRPGRRWDFRGGWALLILSTPIGLLVVHELARSVERNPTWTTLAATATAVGLLGPALLAAALTFRLHMSPRRATHSCPDCGAAH
ncbi:hypothetical protein [Micromonospora siamensis]|uniref:Uncharacterized protein n=1 Tax=Micromonospora siamensis TaxID=299152 RepID=A0A1C5JPK1_9ACTN|nr:hypothetical protein [Micromonospora siamensis]SCG71926.1 hypothetical protein GA0074704_4698 [Micromonospora siamensis]